MSKSSSKTASDPHPRNEAPPQVPNTPRAEFFEKTIHDGNRKVPVVVQVSASGQLVHVLIVDEEGRIKSQERRLGIGSQESNMLLGRLLTLADATFAEDRQCKAFKDMLRQHLREWLTEQENSGMASAGIDGWVGRPFNDSVRPEYAETLEP